MRLRTTILVISALLLTAGTARCASAAISSSAKTGASAAAAKPGAKSRKSSKRRRRERGQMAPTSDRIAEIQQALAKDGSFTGTANGKWDNASVEAMRKFQASHGLNPTGKLDALSLQKLGLGSQTAGVAAPLPPLTTTSLNKDAAPQTANRE